MRELNQLEVIEVSGAKPNFWNLLNGIVMGGIIGLFVGGPPGVLTGMITGAGSAIVKEGGQGLKDLHNEYHN